ncbi:nucleotide exchange factor GrpE [Candidatus Woesearchaeota archaeon]|nr:nucleotide exchange factor GrpE [Candidatus Woesearchaeota archaeon]
MKEDSKIKEKIEIIDELEEGKEESKEKNFLEDLQRVQADFENYIKRVDKEKDRIKEIAKAELLLKLISIKDDFDKAVDINNEGVKIIHNNFKKFLEEEGVKEIKSLGEEFNHNLHEVIKKNGDGKITEEVQKGYMLNDKILRIAKVIIGGK